MTEQQAQEAKQQCIFCQIIAGKISSRKIYEDESCIGILDINPANPGHTLIIPKEHHAIMPLMPESEIVQMFKAAKRISQALISTLKADGTNIFVANGAAAGQKAPHVIMHLIPRRANDGVVCFNLPKNKMAEQDQEKLRQAVTGKLNERLNIKVKEPVVAERPAPEKIETLQEEPAEKENAEEVMAGEQKEFKIPPPAERQEDAAEADSNIFEIPPPEKFEREYAEKEGEKKPKKKEFDIDAISKLFG